MGSLPSLETGQHRNYTGAQEAAPCTPHLFVLCQSLSAALHRPHAATDVVRLCAHLNQTLNHANSSVPQSMLPAGRSEVNRNPGIGVNLSYEGNRWSCVIARRETTKQSQLWRAGDCFASLAMTIFHHT